MERNKKIKEMEKGKMNSSIKIHTKEITTTTTKAFQRKVTTAEATARSSTTLSSSELL